jgi:hypothetical protein
VLRGEVVTDGTRTLPTEGDERERERVEDERAGCLVEAQEGNDILVSWSVSMSLERLEPGEDARFPLEHRPSLFLGVARESLDGHDPGGPASPGC